MAWMAILLTGSDASPSIVMLLTSGGADVFCATPETSGFDPPQPARSKTAAASDHTLMRMGKH
jgi:hypothetical protein